jgi:hypothetical protein
VLQVQVQQEQQVLLAQQVLTAQYQVLLDLKALPVQQDLVFLEVQVLLALPEVLVQKVPQELLEIQV